MEQLVDSIDMHAWLSQGQQWLAKNVLVVSSLTQVALVTIVFVSAYYLAPSIQRWLIAKGESPDFRLLSQKAANVLRLLVFPIVALVMLWLSLLIAAEAGWPHHGIKTVGSLLTAWVIVRMSTQLIRDPVWARFIAVLAWTIAALNILRLLKPTLALLDSLALTAGALRISALTVLKGVLWFVILIWVATAVSRLLEARFSRSENLTPAVQVLLSKFVKIGLITMAVVVAVASVGIDITVFAVFGGALGVGIGLGLQKSVSNLFSGIMLLLDKSIKPGDVIAVNNTYGWVSFLGARYASVVTRDGTEHLIPNEDLITQRVENWSYSDNLLRLKIPIGVHYQSDVEKAMTLCLEAAAETERVLKEPKTACLLKGFGDSSVDIEIRFWINDPQKGISNVKSAVLLRVWHKFHQHGIEIPYPQRDLHLRSGFDANATRNLALSSKSGL
ncbi:MAG: mechanosensitive ion channel [Gammaproteobacteria bacterium]|nr:mechanosensitive ion channel [Gammaproteobacteria bacterium]